MMRAIVLVVLVAAVAGAGYAVWSGAITLPGSGPSCLADEALDAEWRKGPEGRGTAFISALKSGDVKAAYAQLAPQTKEQLSLVDFEQTGGPLLAGLGELSLQHTHRPRGEGEVSCTITGPDAGTATLPAQAGVTQAHLIYTAKTASNDWVVTMSLVETDGTWSVAGFFRSMTSMAGQSTRDLIKLAEAEAAKGHIFNAYMLGVTATYRADRGDDLKLGVAQEAEAALGKLARPVEMKEGPPFVWTFANTRFAVDDVSVMNEAKLALVIVHTDPSWDGKDQAGADKRNRELIDGFLAAHPETKDVFGTIVARMQWPGQGDAWSTVYDTEKGYAPALQR